MLNWLWSHAWDTFLWVCICLLWLPTCRLLAVFQTIEIFFLKWIVATVLQNLNIQCFFCVCVLHQESACVKLKTWVFLFTYDVSVKWYLGIRWMHSVRGCCEFTESYIPFLLGYTVKPHFSCRYVPVTE